MSQAHPPNPYPGPRSYHGGERLFGRRRDQRLLVDTLIAERLVLLHGPSGSGKTSLVQAALIPELVEREFLVLPPVRLSLQSPSPPDTVTNRFVLSLIQSLDAALPADEQLPPQELQALSLDHYFHRSVSGRWPDHDLVLICDQFEEVLTVEPSDLTAKQAFFAQLGALLQRPDLWALFVMRDDFVGALDPYLAALPGRLRSRTRLDLLSRAGAEEAIVGPARLAGVDFPAGVASRLVDDLSAVIIQNLDGSYGRQLGPTVEPVQLQVVCRQIWDRLFSRGGGAGSAITAEDIAAVGDVNQALSSFYADQVAAIAAATGVRERAIRSWFDRELTTASGLRGQVLQTPDSSAGLANAAIDQLIDAQLVRAERRRGATWFELVHDRLIEPVRADNAAWRARTLSPLQRQAALWAQQARPDGLLLRSSALEEAERWASAEQDGLSEMEMSFLLASRKEQARVERERRQGRRSQVLFFVSLALFIGAALLAGLAYALYSQAIAS